MEHRRGGSIHANDRSYHAWNRAEGGWALNRARYKYLEALSWVETESSLNGEINLLSYIFALLPVTNCWAIIVLTETQSRRPWYPLLLGLVNWDATDCSIVKDLDSTTLTFRRLPVFSVHEYVDNSSPSCWSTYRWLIPPRSSSSTQPYAVPVNFTPLKRFSDNVDTLFVTYTKISWFNLHNGIYWASD